MLKKITVALTVCAVSISVFAAPEFATFRDAQKAGNEAWKAKDFQKMYDSFNAWLPKASTRYQKWVCTYGVSRALREMKKYDEALKVLDNFIAVTTDEVDKAEAIFIKGLVYVAKGESNNAVKFFDESLTMPKLQKGSRSQANHNLLNIYYHKKNYDKCIAVADVITKEESGANVEKAVWYKVECLFLQKKYAEAEKLAREFYPKAKVVHWSCRMAFTLAESLLAQDKEDDAVKYYKEYIKLDPKGWRAGKAKRMISELE